MHDLCAGAWQLAHSPLILLLLGAVIGCCILAARESRK